MQTKTTFIQLIKYGIVGVINTLITAVVVWLLLKKAGWADAPANFVGYVAGLINSFVWNRQWTFGANASWRRDLLLFLLVFAVCYAVQLTFVELMNARTQYDTYHNHLMGIVLYSLLNFFLNKFVTFRKANDSNPMAT